jgi:predicted RNA binding protein YcfA (HicA-like mRNA interferase family)
MKFPVDAPKGDILKALELLGFAIVREGNHLILERANADGTSTPLVLPNHRVVKSSTLRTALRQAGVSREEFLDAYSRA